jgi:site-specific recombinase XerD
MLGDLPPSAKRFLRTTQHRRVHIIVRAFHRWLDQRQLVLAKFTPALLERFLTRPGDKRISRRAYIQYRAWIRRYLLWLYHRSLVGFVPLRGRNPQALPPLAHTFLASLAPTLRPATVHCYTFSLRKLYSWLEPRHLTPEHLTRPHVERWLRWLHDADLHASSRHHVLVESRAYLRWLSDRRRMRTLPDELIRKSDFPKIPRYLPRPLSAEADRELQRRLAASPDPLAWALLLMRRTGLRIGELRDLAYHCVRADERRPMLKVPLGKLNNERLVPLDTTSVDLICRLQSTGPSPRSWLVPGVRESRAPYDRIRRTLTMQCRGLPEPTRITCHRLRHTFATEMLNAGMSLLGVMRLLGHRSYQMTLRYAAITSGTVEDEYAKALAQLSTKYQLQARTPLPGNAPTPGQLLDQLARWLRKYASPPRHQRSLLKRIERLRLEVQKFETAKRTP